MIMLLNYTTKIDPDKTAAEISKCLSMHGASAVMTEYDPSEGQVMAISFKIRIADREVGFRLPSDYKPVLEILKKNSKIKEWHRNYSRVQSEFKLQAVRTAWRIVKDWVEAQMALVETQMVTPGQVFLPYMVMKDGKTLSEKLIKDPQFLLGEGK